MNFSSHKNPALADCIAQHAELTLFRCDDGRSISYGSALDLSQHPGFREASRRLVLCFCDNESSSLLGYLALMACDAVPLVVGSSLSVAKLQKLLQAYQPDFVWLPDSRLSELPEGRSVLSFGGYSLLASGCNKGYAIDSSLALLLSTSGSTGSPKFVRLSHENLMSNAMAISQYLELTLNELPITTLPPSYTYGLSIIHSHILNGATIALTNQTFFNRGFWDFLEATGATSLSGVPYHYEILKKLRFSRMNLPSLRTLTQAGGRMNPDSTRDFATHCRSRGMRFFTMYGQAEATARMSYLHPENAVEKAGSIGRAIPGGNFWLEDELGQRVEGSEVEGELVYQGGNVFMGYAEGYQDLSKPDECKGILKTGDLARRDADGDYYIVGRLKRFLKIFGHRINLQDVEELISASGFSVACAGRDDHLDIYLSNGDFAMGRQIKEKLVAELKVAPGAVRVLGISEIPHSESGKIQYSLLETLPSESLA